MAQPGNLLPLLQAAGFKGNALRTAWAIAMRESGGNPQAFNGNRSTGDQSYGLFQINMLGNMGPGRRAEYGLQNNNQLFDPATNAKVAYRMSKGGTDFGAWGLGPNAYAGAPRAAHDAFVRYYSAYPGAAGSSNGRIAGSEPAGGGSNPSPATSQLAAAAAPQQQRDYFAPVRQALAQLPGVGGSLDRSGFYQVLGNALRQQQAAQQPRAATVPGQPLPYRQGQPVAAQTMPASNGLALAAVPLTDATRQGIQLDQRIAPAAEQVANQFGVRINSGYRSPQHNAAVGGVPNSDHLTGDAVDYTGSPAAMRKLYQWALQQHFPYVEPWGQAGGNHVHISFRRR